MKASINLLKGEKYLTVLVVGIFLLLSFTTSYAKISIDFNQMMSSLKDNLPAVIRLTTAFAYVLGTLFVISGLSDLKTIGHSSSMQQQTSMSGPLMKILMGVMLIYLPSTRDSLMLTFWQTDSIVEYTGGGGQFAQMKEGIVLLIRTLGYIALVRGLVVLSRVGYQGSQPGTVGKGFLYIIGGVLAINIVATIEIVQNSLGISGII